ncbi:MAG: glycosyltransferase [Microthrixaceae bacterium]
MKVGIYNRHWRTMGGGEKFGAGIAEVLQAENRVELLTPHPLDVAAFADRFGLQLDDVTVRVLDNEPNAVARTSADYDLFINVSYLSADRSRAPRSIYVVHFPSPLGVELAGWRRILGPLSRLAHRGAQPVPNGWGDGFYPTEHGRRSVTWTSGAAEIFVLPEGDTVDLRLRFGYQRPPEAGAAQISIEVDGVEQVTAELPPRPSRLARGMELRVPVPRRDDLEPSSIVIRSNTFSPAELFGVDDDRRLGVPLLSMYVGSTVLAPIRARLPVLHHLRQPTYVDSYTVIAANAEFTQGFVRRWWGVDAEVLYPPVAMQSTGTKKPIILSVGRFFRADRGHSKKQLEMVDAFRSICESGVDGWELHLVGGCSAEDEPYLNEVIASAAGLPVFIHRDVPGHELRSLYAAASIFWSITGIGEDEREHPARFEHFGITTVEAMSAGAVPVVLAAGGQVEIVRDGVNGAHIRTTQELSDVTAALIADPARLAALRTGAEQRARDFDMNAFGARLRELVQLATS